MNPQTTTINPNNVFSRIAYGLSDQLFQDASTNGVVRTRTAQTFAGGDLQVWFNNIQVQNVEAITWSSSVEIIGLYGMGNRNPQGYVKGKRALVGSMSMTQYDRHALLEEVFQLTTKQNNTQSLTTLGQLFQNGSAGASGLANKVVPLAGRFGTTTIDAAATLSYPSSTDPTSALSVLNLSAARGLSNAQLNQILDQEFLISTQVVGQELIDYVDMIPPFDIKIIGVNEVGASASCVLYGVQVTQETDGRSMNDLSPSMGLSFVFEKAVPWRPYQVQ